MYNNEFNIGQKYYNPLETDLGNNVVILRAFELIHHIYILF